jgi:hypothetical protein
MAQCDLNQLVADSACLNCLSQSEKEAVFLAYGAKALLAVDGPDYTNLNTLRDAVSCWCVGGQVLDSFVARVAVNAAVNSGAIASVPSIATIRETIKCYPCGVGGGELQAMRVLILCALLNALIPAD